MRRFVAWAAWSGLLCALAAPARAAAGADGAAFLRLPVGARPATLGGAYDALATDAYAPALNPAGLGFLGGAGLSASHVLLLDSMSYDALSAAAPLRRGRGGLGASLQYFSPGRVAGTNAAGAPAGDFNGYSYAAGAAYGRAVTRRLALGAAVKAVRAEIAGASAGAFAADLGALFRATERVSLSAAAANLGGPLKFVSREDALPRQLRLGAAVAALPSLDVAVQGAFEDEGPNAGLGAEWRPLGPLALRAGYRSDAARSLGGAAGLTFGMGLRAGALEFGYALLPMGELGALNYFTLAMALGRTGEGGSR